jgi:hypothetical protein
VLQLKNGTPFAATVALLPDTAGIDTLFTVIKGTFTINEGLALAETQVPVSFVDEHHGDPAVSSVRAPSDLCLGKPATDVVLLGSAWAPGGRPVWSTDVSLTAGPVSKTVRVFGDRVWDSGPAGSVIAPVAPFVRVPLVWERAYGGTDETDAGPVIEPRNPVGCGFRAPRSVRPAAGLPVPNLEDPATLITSLRDAPRPACFAPVASHWEPRRSFAGTYDDDWQNNRSPYLPHDFNPRFFQIAPMGLTAPGYLQGGEWVDVRGATPSGVLQFQLPAWSLLITYRLAAGEQQRLAELDTIVIEPDAARLTLVWRAALQCDKKALQTKAIEASVVGAAQA